MGDLLKKLDEIMTGDLVRKLGGLFCLVTVIISVVAFIIGAGSLLKSIKGPVADVEITEEEGAEGEATDEEAEEEAEGEEATDEEAEEEAEGEEATGEEAEEEAEE
jgi:hypothetical protein